MPPTRRRSSSVVRSAATQIQKRVRGKQTRKRHSRSIEQIYRNLEIANQCSICLESMLNNGSITKLACTHRFHTECLKTMAHRGLTRCPMCRTPMTNTERQLLRSPRQTQRAITPQQVQQIRQQIQQVEQRQRMQEEAQRQLLTSQNQFNQPVRAIAMSGNPSPYLLHLQRRWDAQSRLNTAQQELADYQSSGINDTERERILNNRLRFANMELRQSMGNFTNI